MLLHRKDCPESYHPWMHDFVYSADVASATIGLVSVLFLAMVVELRLKPRVGRADRIISNVVVIGIGLFVAFDFLWNLIAIGTGGSKGSTGSLEFLYTVGLVFAMTLYITIRALARRTEDNKTGRHPEG